jgi:hemolysin activation/secretion protein
MFKKICLLFLLTHVVFLYDIGGLNFRPSPAAVRQSLMLSQNQAAYDTSDINIQEPADYFTGTPKPLTLYSVTLEGSSVFGDEQVLEMSKDLIGKSITTADLESLAQRLTKLYQEKGYVFSYVYVPFQQLKKGVIRLKAIENSVIKTTFRWINMPSDDGLKKDIENLKIVRPFNIDSLNLVIDKVRRKPGHTLSFTLKSTQVEDENGGEIIAIIARQSITHKMGVSNTMPESLGSWVARGDVQFNSLLGMGDQLKVFGAVYPTHKFNRLMHYGAEFSVPIMDLGTRAFLFTDLLRDQPDLRSQGLTRARGRLKSYGIGLEQDLSLSHQIQGHARLMLDRKNFTEHTQSQQGVQRDIQQKNLALHLLSHFEKMDYDWGETELNVGYHHGLNDENSHQRGTDQRGNLNFRKITAALSQQYAIDEFWSLVGSMRGQYALNQPVYMERFFYGGAPFSFAHPVGVLVGDSGVQAKIEVRYGLAIDDFLKKMTVYSYLETGKVWNRGLKVSTERTSMLSGMGIGVRGMLKWGLSAFIEYGVPFKHHVDQFKVKNQLYSGLSLSNQAE